VPYLVGLIALMVSAVAGIGWFIRDRPALREGGHAPVGARAGAVGFVVLVAALALATAIAAPGGLTTEGRVFPETMTLFSARAFAAFFSSLALGALTLLVLRASVAAYRFFAATGLLLIAPITLAALVNIGRFDFVGQPGHAVYLGAYLVVGAGAAGLLILTRRPADAHA
jgi:hypothetical protein